MYRRELFRLLALTGMRRGEAIGLRWSDVDFRLGHVSIRQAVTVVDGEEVVDAPKTRSHRGSSDEPLLALPDAIGWAVGAGGYFAKQVARHACEIFVSDQTG